MRVPERIGTWEGGILYGTFRDTRNVGLAVVRGLTNLQQRGERAELEPAAQARAADLAAAARREGYTQSGAFARVVLVPLLDPPLLDAVALDERHSRRSWRAPPAPRGSSRTAWASRPAPAPPG